MANDTDHRLVSELMDVVQQRDGVRVAAQQSGPAPGGRRILDIVLWSSITNVTLLACFLVGWNFEEIRANFLPGSDFAVAAANAEEAPPSARQDLEDNELLTRGPQRQLKGPLQITLVPATEPDVPADQATEVASIDSDAPDSGGVDQDQGDGAGDITVGPEDPAAQLAKSPVLQKGQKSGEVQIGNFETVSLPGSSSECLDTAYSLLEDAGAPRSKLKVLADSKMITVARICADNGSLVVTCRMDQITISPRRLKPNEACTG